LDRAVVTVNLDVSLANTSVPVYVRSNGAGNQAFFAPTGTARNSATTQVTVGQPLPTVTWINGTFQLGATGLPFEIDGTNFYSGTPGQPGVSFAQPPPGSTANCGISNVTIITYTSTTVTGTLDTTQAVAGQCTVTVTQYQSTQSASQTFTITPGPPTISGYAAMWWFGGYTPECTNPAVAACYITSTVLTVTPGPGGNSPSANSPAVWRPGANGGNVTIECSDPNDLSCASVTVSANGATAQNCDDTNNQTQITVTLEGVTSSPFYVVVDMPKALEVAVDWVGTQYRQLVVDVPYTANNHVGYSTIIYYLIRSGCGQLMTPVPVNEYFDQNTTSLALFNGAFNNWPFVVNNTSDPRWTGSWDVGGFNPDNYFRDTLTSEDYPPGATPPGVAPYNPEPQPPPADPTNAGTFLGTSAVWLTSQRQTFRTGSLTQGNGYMVQQGYVTDYLDHARVLPLPPQ